MASTRVELSVTAISWIPSEAIERPVQDPVRARRHPLRPAAARPARGSGGAPHDGSLPGGERAPGLHRGRGRPHRRLRPPRSGPHRGDDRPRRPRGDPVPRGPPARHPARAGGRPVLGPLRADRRRPHGPPDAPAGAAQAVRPVLAVDRLDDPGPDDQRRRHVEPRARRRQPVPAPLDLRRPGAWSRSPASSTSESGSTIRSANGRRGARQDSPAVVAAVESALERSPVRRRSWRGDAKPKIRTSRTARRSSTRASPGPTSS